MSEHPIKTVNDKHVHFEDKDGKACAPFPEILAELQAQGYSIVPEGDGYVVVRLQ